MKLSRIISQAQSGELQNIAVKSDIGKIVQYINAGLIALYGRFLIQTEEAIITMRAGKTLYKLDGTDPDVTVAGQPVPEDQVMVVLSAYDESGELPINDETQDASIYTPTFDTIQIPYPEDGNYVSAVYRCNPEWVEYEEDVTDTRAVNVKLPTVLLEPLLHYIGYRAHGAIDGNIQAENSTHYTRFKQACMEVEALGLLPTDSLDKKNSTKGFMV